MRAADNLIGFPKAQDYRLTRRSRAPIKFRHELDSRVDFGQAKLGLAAITARMLAETAPHLLQREDGRSLARWTFLKLRSAFAEKSRELNK